MEAGDSGGVGVAGGVAFFTMAGGTIGGNKAGLGGGAGIRDESNIIKTGGIIYGYDADDTVNSNKADGSDAGHAYRRDVWPPKKRNTTAGSEVNLDSRTETNWK